MPRRQFHDDYDFRERPERLLERRLEPDLARRYPLPARPRNQLPGPSLLDRDLTSIATPWRDPFKNEVTVINRRIANGLVQKFASRPLIGGADKTAISARRAYAKAVPTSTQKPKVSAKAIAADRRFQNFNSWPKTVFGTYAAIAPRRNGRLRFLVPWAVLPCVQRTTRREVLFARKHAGGRASRRQKRRGPHSHIGC